MKVIVVGGGPAGCAAAYTLLKEGHEAVLFEASDSIGGRTKQLHREGFNLSTGALFLMGGIYPRTMALLREMGHIKKLVPWKSTAELMDDDDSRYPVQLGKFSSFAKVPTLKLIDKLRLLTTGIKLFFSRTAKNPFNGSQLAAYDRGENLEDWTRNNLGSRTYEYVMRPIMDFLYAVPLRELSTPFPKALVRQAHKISLSTPPEGIGQINDWLLENMSSDDVHLSAPVDRLARDGNGWKIFANGDAHQCDAMIIATEAFIAAKLLKEFISIDAYQRLMGTHYTEYAHVAIAYDEDPWPDYPVDAVLPVGVDGDRDVGAMVLHGRRQPASVPDGGQLVGVYFNTPPLANMSDEEIKNRAIEQVHEAFGEAPRPRFVHLFRYEKGLTIAKPGHYGILDKVHELLPPNIRLAGDYFSQAGVEAAVYSGEHAAKSLSK
ncbi:MAG: protoporphyrinogen/coproporphyrinogen oxidase [Rhodospirillales bacterium]